MRKLLLGALVGGLLLLAPHPALATPHGISGLPSAAPVSYAQVPLDNPSEPGEAFPTDVFAYAVENPSEPGEAFPTNVFAGGTA